LSEATIESEPTQQEIDESEAARSLLDQLLKDSQLYTQSNDYQQLLDFVVRLRNFAPFNAMLLQVQKPGLSYAASACDWRERFGRVPKAGARPLLILWPFGPVALVYDIQDTEGPEVPQDAWSFLAHGPIDEQRLRSFIPLINRKNIRWCWFDGGDNKAGSIQLVQRASEEEPARYRLLINSNHRAPVQFTTLTHELGHLFLGHLGPDKALKVLERPTLDHVQQELEAESVAYLVCKRNAVEPRSKTYLAHFVSKNTKIENADVYQVMRATGQIESLLGLSAHSRFEKPNNRAPSAQGVPLLG
jgi:hypothetical protein